MKRPPIPSDYIEPYLKDFLIMKLEALNAGWVTPEQFRHDLLGVDSFIGFCGGVHAVLATNNMFSKLCYQSDKELLEIAKNTFDRVEHIKNYH